MNDLNAFAERHGRVFKNWSKIWEYPWLWMHGLSSVRWEACDLLDVGSELSPLPWYLAKRGARVLLVELDTEQIRNVVLPLWQLWKDELGVNTNWLLIDSEVLPLPDESVDVITSLSVIEHQRYKSRAIHELARVLRPGGLLAISFDVCEPGMHMAYPARYGRALSLREFEYGIWRHPSFAGGVELAWNTDDIPAFLEWHCRQLPGHRYTVGAAVLRRRAR